MSGLGALTMAWIAVEAALPMEWQLAGVWRDPEMTGQWQALGKWPKWTAGG